MRRLGEICIDAHAPLSSIRNVLLQLLRYILISKLSNSWPGRVQLPFLYISFISFSHSSVVAGHCKRGDRCVVTGVIFTFAEKNIVGIQGDDAD